MSDIEGGPYSRRQFLRGAATVAGVAATAGLADACGSSSSSPGTKSETTVLSGATMPSFRTPRKGGVMRIGAATGSSADTLNDATASAQVDFMRTYTLFGTLLDSDRSGRIVPSLAAEITAENSRGDVWTVRLRDGVEFHNGKSLTADDLIFSLHYHLKTVPTSVWGAGLSAYGFDLVNGVKKLDRLTVRFKLTHPYAVFTQFPVRQGYWVVPEGYTQSKPIGTGAFQYKSFTPGQESVYTRFPNYWGRPAYLDELVIVDLPDENARVSALLSGQVDAIQIVPVGAIQQIKNNSHTQLMITPTGDWNPLVMRMDVPPFNDVRVRQAFRLLIDRPAMLGQSVGGYGVVANDLFCPVDPAYDSGIPQRHQDLEQAKALLKAAGYENNLTVNLVTSPLAAGLVETCEVFQAQAASAGVNVKVSQTPAGTFYGKAYLQRPFTVDFFQQPLDYFPMVTYTDGTSGAIFNATHNHNAKYQSLYQEGIRTLDSAKRTAIAREMQVIAHDSGGYIIPYFPSLVEAVSTKTAGWQNWATYYGMNGYHFEDIGFA